MSWLFSGDVLGRFLNPQKRRAEATGDTDLLVVRRGMSPAFYFFCRIFAGERRLLMVEDRRVRNRRLRQRPTPSTDRREYDERRRATATMSHTDFWVVPGNRVDDAPAVSRPSSTSALHRSDSTARKHSHMRPAP